MHLYSQTMFHLMGMLMSVELDNALPRPARERVQIEDYRKVAF